MGISALFTCCRLLHLQFCTGILREGPRVTQHPCPPPKITPHPTAVVVAMSPAAVALATSLAQGCRRTGRSNSAHQSQTHSPALTPVPLLRTLGTLSLTLGACPQSGATLEANCAAKGVLFHLRHCPGPLRQPTCPWRWWGPSTETSDCRRDFRGQR